MTAAAAAAGTGADGTTTTTDGGDAGAGTATTSTEGEEGTDKDAEIAKWKELARKHEDRAKNNAGALRELETLKQQTMSDTEKAIDIAKKEARIEALREVGGRLVDAEVRAAAAGRPDDVITALLEGLDKSRFLDDDGEPDVKAIKAWVDRVAPAQQDSGFPDLGQGNRQSSSAGSDNPLLAELTKLSGR